MLDEQSIRSRALSAVLEPVIASVSFSPEAHEAFHALGFGPTSGMVSDEWGLSHWGRTAMPDYTAYMTSRGASLGTPKGEVVAALFGVFQPALVISMVTAGQAIAGSAEIRAARDFGAIAQLVRILGPQPDGLGRAIELLTLAGRDLRLPGRPLYAGLMAEALPTEPLGAMWRLGERLREFRGDAFVSAWTSVGFDGCQLQLLTEILAGFPPRSYTSARGWTPEEMDSAERDLTALGYVADGKPTDEGRRVREEIEAATDRMCMPMIHALGDDVVELVAILQGWGDAIMAADGHAPATPQEQVMDADIQRWMEKHNHHRFGFGPA